MSNIPAISNLPIHALLSHNKSTKNQELAQSKNQGNEKIDETKLEAACTEFESLFIHHLFKEMRQTIPKSDFLDGGMAEDIYTDMFDAQVANKLSKK